MLLLQPSTFVCCCCSQEHLSVVVAAKYICMLLLQPRTLVCCCCSQVHLYVVVAAKDTMCRSVQCDKEHGYCAAQGSVETCHCERGYKLSAVDQSTCVGECLICSSSSVGKCLVCSIFMCW